MTGLEQVAKVRQPKMVSCLAEVRAGPERAAMLGVPVGTVVQVQETRRYRNPLRQLLWRLRNPGGGRITISEGGE